MVIPCQCPVFCRSFQSQTIPTGTPSRRICPLTGTPVIPAAPLGIRSHSGLQVLISDSYQPRSVELVHRDLSCCFWSHSRRRQGWSGLVLTNGIHARREYNNSQLHPRPSICHETALHILLVQYIEIRKSYPGRQDPCRGGKPVSGGTDRLHHV